MLRLHLKIGKTRKYLLIGGAVLLLSAFVYRTYPSLVGLLPRDEEIVLKKRHIAKYLQVVGEKDKVKDRLASLRKRVRDLESGLLKGKTPALAAADIQKTLHKMAEKSKVEIKRVRVLKVVELGQGDYVGIPVQLNIKANIRQLKELLYRIEASPKYLTVKKMKIRVLTRRRVKHGMINSDITVYGYLKRQKDMEG